MSIFIVTGGAGFIGSTFIRLLLETIPDASVINIDALTYAGDMSNLRALMRSGTGSSTEISAIENLSDGLFQKAVKLYSILLRSRTLTEAFYPLTGLFTRTCLAHRCFWTRHAKRALVVLYKYPPMK